MANWMTTWETLIKTKLTDSFCFLIQIWLNCGRNIGNTETGKKNKCNHEQIFFIFSQIDSNDSIEAISRLNEPFSVLVVFIGH